MATVIKSGNHVILDLVTIADLFMHAVVETAEIVE